MDICHIQLQSTPQILFAHRFDTDHYDIYNGRIPDTLEICYILSGDITGEVLETGEVFTVQAGSLLCLPYQKNRYHFHSDRFHRHVTAGIFVKHTFCTDGGLVLPHYMTFGAGQDAGAENGERIRDCLEALARDSCLQPSGDLSSAKALSLLGLVSETYLRQMESAGVFGRDWYVNRAKQYIMNHISEQIPVSEIASFLEISPGYLSHMFTEATGMTLVKFINSVRMDHLETLVVHYGMPLKEAALRAGIPDPNYASRLFRRIRGCTLSEIKRQRYTTKELRIKGDCAEQTDAVEQFWERYRSD